MLKSSLGINIIVNYFGQFYSMLIGIFMLPFYLKYLGAESYGLVGFFTMLNSWMMMLDIGLSQTLSREVARLKDKKEGIIEIKRALRSVESLVLPVILCAATIIFLNSSFISTRWLHFDVLSLDTVENCVKLMAVMTVFRWFSGLYNGVIVGLELQVWLNVFRILSNTVRFVGGLILVLYVSNDIFHFFIFQLCIAVIEFLFLFVKINLTLYTKEFIGPTIEALVSIAPFALKIFYISSIWVVFTQLDKLLLSHYIPLKEYGYFVLIVTITNVVNQLSSPLSQVLSPRMVSLCSNGEIDKMLALYKKGTKMISILVFSVAAMISLFSYELLLSWTGSVEASTWASPALSWYVLGNAILSVLSFQYFLQFAYGDLSYHIKFNTIFPFFAIPIIFFGVSNYGATGAAISWFSIQLFAFIIWPPFIHKKFAKGIHTRWLREDIFPATLVTGLYVLILSYINIDFNVFSRLETFSILVCLGLVLLMLNIFVYPSLRMNIIQIVYKEKTIET